MMRGSARRAAGLCAILLGLACRSRVEEPARRTSASDAEVKQDSRAAVKVPREPSMPWRFPAAERVVAVGDLHGDLAATRQALRLAGALDARDGWRGGKLVLVQTGDQLDRGDEEREVLELLERVGEEAKRAGGALHVLNGNHELMNVSGDFRYVTPRGFANFAEYATGDPVAQRWARYPTEARGRAAAFLPGGPMALKLARRNTIVVVGDSAFVHGGVLPAHASDVGGLNEELRRFVSGIEPAAPASLSGEDSPVWTRYYSDGTPNPAVCATLADVLARLDAKRMVVGHTPQKNGINSACDGRVWRIDVGMAKAYGGRPAVLEIARGEVRVIADAGVTIER